MPGPSRRGGIDPSDARRRRARASIRGSLALLVVALGATAWIWARHPELFLGHR